FCSSSLNFRRERRTTGPAGASSISSPLNARLASALTLSRKPIYKTPLPATLWSLEVPCRLGSDQALACTEADRSGSLRVQMRGNPRITRSILIDVQNCARYGEHDRSLGVELDVIPPPNLNLRRVPTDVRAPIADHNEQSSFSPLPNLVSENVKTVGLRTPVGPRVKPESVRVKLRNRELDSLRQRL